MCNTQQPGVQPQAQAAQQQPTDPQSIALEIARTQYAQAYNATDAGKMIAQFEAVQRIAQMFATSTIVPKTYQGNIGNCVIALDIANRLNIPHLMVMQNLYVVNGNPTWSAKFLVATINQCGRYTSLRYRIRNLGKVGKVKYNATVWDSQKKQNTLVVKEFDGTDIDNLACVAYATEVATGEILESAEITLEMAIKEGWYQKLGSKWQTMPQLMLTYRAASFWQRQYAPEIALGFMTTEEAQDIVDVDYTDMQAQQRKDDQRMLAERKKDELRDALQKTAAQAQPQAQAAQAQPQADAAGKGGLFEMP
jgi:hypothetical protein